MANGRVGHIKAAHLGTHLLGDGSEAFTAASSKLKLKCFPSLGLLLLFNINSSANEERMEGGKLNDKSRVEPHLNILPRLESLFVFCVV